MRVWALASCGTLFALVACSSDSSTPPAAEGEQSGGDDAVWLDHQPQTEVGTSASLAGPETTLTRPQAKSSGQTSRDQLNTLGTLPSSHKAKQLRKRLGRIQTEQASILSRTQALGPGSTQPQPAGAGQTPATPEETAAEPLASADAGTAPAPHPWSVTPSPLLVTPRLVTPRPGPSALRLSSPPNPTLDPNQQAAEPIPPSNQNKAIPLAAVEAASTNAQDLVTPSLLDTAPPVASASGMDPGRTHYSLSADAAGAIPPLNPSPNTASAPTEDTAIEPVPPAAIRSHPSPPPPSSSIAATANRQPSLGHHQVTAPAVQAQGSPAEGVQHPRFSAIQLSPGAVPSPRLHGTSESNARASRILAARVANQRAAGSSQGSAVATSAEATTDFAGTPAKIAPSLPLHEDTAQSQRVRPLAAETLPPSSRPTAEDGSARSDETPVSSSLTQAAQPAFGEASPGRDGNLQAQPTAFSDAEAPVRTSGSAHHQALHDLEFSETIRLHDQRFSSPQTQSPAAELPDNDSTQPDSEITAGIDPVHQSTPCVSQAISQEIHERSARPAPEVSRAISTPSKSLMLPAQVGDQAISFSKSKVCPTGTKPLAQIIPDAATAGTPIPGMVESPTR